MSDLNFKRINRILKYKANRVKVYEDEYERPDKCHVFYDYVENKNGAGILLINKDGDLVLIKQYRITLDRCDLEIAAGSLDEGEDEAEAALREAEEETGYIPQKIFKVNNIIGSVGLFSERTMVYIGYDLKEGTIRRDPDEFMEVVTLSLDKALSMINEGEICDSKTIIAILYYALNKNVIF